MVEVKKTFARSLELIEDACHAIAGIDKIRLSIRQINIYILAMLAISSCRRQKTESASLCAIAGQVSAASFLTSGGLFAQVYDSPLRMRRKQIPLSENPCTMIRREPRAKLF